MEPLQHAIPLDPVEAGDHDSRGPSEGVHHALRGAEPASARQGEAVELIGGETGEVEAVPAHGWLRFDDQRRGRSVEG